MGSELVSDSLTPYGVGGKAPTPSLTEVFYQHLPFYLSIGLSFEQYWDGDCLLAKYYREAHELKQKRRNQELWMQGLYIYEALADLAPILRSFNNKPQKAEPYPSEPFPLTPKEIREKKEREQKAAYEQIKSRFMGFMTAHNQKMSEVKTDG